MTTTRRALVGGVAAFLVIGGVPRRGAAQPKEPRLTLRVGKAAWTYTEEQLRAMATDTLPNLKATKKKPAIPLEVLLFRDTKVAPDRVEMVFLIGDKITVLRGGDLKYLDKLVLATGEPKGGKLHKWSLAPEDEATYKAVSPHMGSRRKGGIYRIDIVLKGEPQ
jgi:hypothetical protein